MIFWIGPSVLAMSPLLAGGQVPFVHSGAHAEAMNSTISLTLVAGDDLPERVVGAGTQFEHLSGGGFDLVAAAFVLPIPPEPCTADINGDGRTDTLDLIEFMEAWSLGSDRAEITGEGSLDTQDFVEFIRLWSSGCP